MNIILQTAKACFTVMVFSIVYCVSTVLIRNTHENTTKKEGLIKL